MKAIVTGGVSFIERYLVEQFLSKNSVHAKHKTHFVYFNSSKLGVFLW